MHIFWESRDWPGGRVEPGVTCLTWLPETDTSEGLLGVGSQSGAVGITRTNIRAHCSSQLSNPKRVNFNLRGHHNSICIVAWNFSQSKLATCDDIGTIYVWVPYEERWSVELVNERGSKVRDFCWSPNGNSALICYEDNFILIGSATGQRIWHRTFEQTISCGAWAPESKQVVLGSGDGTIHLLTDHGTQIHEYSIRAGVAVERLAWSCQRSSDLRSTLCVGFGDGVIHFMQSCDDADPVVHETDLEVVCMQWSLNGEYLAVAGVKKRPEGSESPSTSAPVVSSIIVFCGSGKVVYKTDIPNSTKPLTALTWAHEDQCVVVACGGDVNVGRVVTHVPSLSSLTSYRVWASLSGDRATDQLPLPAFGKQSVNIHNYHIIQCKIPNPQELYGAVCKPNKWRSYCTIRPVPRQSQCYSLCMEHMGGLVPVLQGKQIHKVLPEFEIRLHRSPEKDRSTSRSRSGTPEMQEGARAHTATTCGASGPGRDNVAPAPVEKPRELEGAAAASASDMKRGSFQRDSMWRRSKRQLQALVNGSRQNSAALKKEDKLVLVTSNVWCTRFKLVGMASQVLPPYLGQVNYKTSVLHLQPRQMTVQVVNLEDGNGPPVAPPPENDHNDGADENLLSANGDEGPPVAPLDTEIFYAHNTTNGLFLSADHHNNNNIDEEILGEEQVLLNEVLNEFSDLRQAVDQHIQRMREFASDLQRSSAQLNTQQQQRVATAVVAGPMASSGGSRAVKKRSTDAAPSSRLPPTPSAPVKEERKDRTPPSYRKDLFAISTADGHKADSKISKLSQKENNAAGGSCKSKQTVNLTDSTNKPSDTVSLNSAEVANEKCSKTKLTARLSGENKSWECQLRDLEFIDEDESLVVHSDAERRRLQARALSFCGSPATPPPDLLRSHHYSPSAVSIGRRDKQHSSRSRVAPPLRTRSEQANGILSIRFPAPAESMNRERDSAQKTSETAEKNAVVAESAAPAVVSKPPVVRGNSKQLKEITSVLDKLSNLASEFAARSAGVGVDGSGSGADGSAQGSAHANAHPQGGGKICPHPRQVAPPALVMDTDPGEPYSQLRSRIREIAQGVNQLERRINYGNELLDDVRNDLKRRVDHIRTVLGDPQDESALTSASCRSDERISKSPKDHHFAKLKCTPTDSAEEIQSSNTSSTPRTDNQNKKNSSVLTLQNKAPFWNENSQVYQLDFGGRVTQESAKNFQIEHDETQVMQFGRIENGAYTLDFQKPFSAVQAFAIALASITQRLK